MAVVVGSKAPAFALPAKPGDIVDLGQVIGREKCVLLFFPLAFSSVCTAEMCHFRDTWSRWQGLNAKVFGISIDSPFVTDKFREMEKLPFPLLSDFNKEIAATYGALHDELMGLRGVTKRAAFVIDAKGIVRYAKVNESPKDQVDFAAIEKAVESC